jgi:multicomponent Na+:H+ antiporter subunit B
VSRDRTALAVFAVGAAGVAVMLGICIAGIPHVGDTPHPYGQRAVAAAVHHRTANVVGSVTFDERGFDTLGEEFVLFASAVAAILLLRRMHSEDEDAGARHTYGEEDVFESLRLVGYVALPVTVLVGGYVVAHGAVSPGGGFQGGVVLATALHLTYLAGDFRALERLRPVVVFDVSESVAAAAFVVIGLAALVFGAAFLANALPYGAFTQLPSSGTVLVLNVAVGAEVGSAIVLLLAKFLDQALLIREEGKGA